MDPLEQARRKAQEAYKLCNDCQPTPGEHLINNIILAFIVAGIVGCVCYGWMT
jgi:hypothetical protein